MNKSPLPHINTRNGLSLAAMEGLAKLIAGEVQPGDLITLRGDLGAGKTTFARSLIQSLMKDAAEVTSPTFNLMQSYDVMLADGTPETLWHLDLYRLEEESEAEMLGLRELERHVMLIEWPEIIEHTLPASRLDVTFTFGSDMQSRDILLQGTEEWAQRLAAHWFPDCEG